MTLDDIEAMRLVRALEEALTPSKLEAAHAFGLLPSAPPDRLARVRLLEASGDLGADYGRELLKASLLRMTDPSVTDAQREEAAAVAAEAASLLGMFGARALLDAAKAEAEAVPEPLPTPRPPIGEAVEAAFTDLEW